MPFKFLDNEKGLDTAPFKFYDSNGGLVVGGAPSKNGEPASEPSGVSWGGSDNNELTWIFPDESWGKSNNG